MRIESGVSIPPPTTGRDPIHFDRDAEIVRLHTDEGFTLSEIGRRYGITRERVRQIVRREGVPTSVTRENWTADRVTITCEWCGGEFEVYEKQADIRKHCANECASKSLGELNKKYTDDNLLARLREIGREVGHVPTAGEVDGRGPPGRSTYQYRFGSLSAAQEAAGMPATKVGKTPAPWPPEDE